MFRKLDVNTAVPELMKLMRFHGKLNARQIRDYTNYGKASLNFVLNSMTKHGLLVKKGKEYELSKNSKHWLGWKSFNN